MASYTGNAELIPEDGGSPIAVEVRLHTVNRGRSLTGWGGTAIRTGGELLRSDQGPQYTLRLPSGNEGTLFVKRAPINWRLATGLHQRIHVEGSGPAPF